MGWILSKPWPWEGVTLTAAKQTISLRGLWHRPVSCVIHVIGTGRHQGKLGEILLMHSACLAHDCALSANVSMHDWVRPSNCSIDEKERLGESCGWLCGCIWRENLKSWNKCIHGEIKMTLFTANSTKIKFINLLQGNSERVIFFYENEYNFFAQMHGWVQNFHHSEKK